MRLLFILTVLMVTKMNLLVEKKGLYYPEAEI